MKKHIYHGIYYKVKPLLLCPCKIRKIIHSELLKCDRKGDETGKEPPKTDLWLKQGRYLSLTKSQWIYIRALCSSIFSFVTWTNSFYPGYIALILIFYATTSDSFTLCFNSVPWYGVRAKPGGKSWVWFCTVGGRFLTGCLSGWTLARSWKERME